MKNILFLTLFISLAFFTACDSEEFEVRQDSLENVKADASGEWTLFSITRNKTDISEHFDTSGMKLTLSGANFTLSSSSFPFPTLKTTGTAFSTGNWAFDDDYQPSVIHFKGGSETVPVNLTYPLYGKNNNSLGLEFSLGCGASTYQYQFKK
jgi:hypothetical protein